MAHLLNVNLSNDNWSDTSAGLIAVGIFEDKSLTEIAQDIDSSTNGVFTNAIKIGDIKGKNSESHLFYVNDKRVLLLGLGKKEKFNSNTARLVAGKASRMGIKKKVIDIAIQAALMPDSASAALRTTSGGSVEDGGPRHSSSGRTQANKRFTGVPLGRGHRMYHGSCVASRVCRD